MTAAVGVYVASTLELDDAISRLIEWGLVDEAAIVAGDLALSLVARRNRSQRLERRQGPSYLIKEAPPAALDRCSLRTETRFYRLCRRQPAAAELARLMPRLVEPTGDDRSERGTLILELIAGRPLGRFYRDRPADELPAWPAAAFGAALAALHAIFRPPSMRRHPDLGTLSEEPPEMLSIHRPSPRGLAWISTARLRLLRAVQSDERIGVALDAARDGWRVETLLHGDVRFDNVVVLEDEREIRLVDWELIRRGDPAWDVAGALQDFVQLWLRGLPQAPELEPAARIADAVYLLPTLHPLVRAFWHGYRDNAKLDDEAAGNLLRRAVSYAGARLIQGAWERSRHAERMSSYAVLLLQTSANLLADPARAAVTLFGLDLDEPAPPMGGDR